MRSEKLEPLAAKRRRIGIVESVSGLLMVATSLSFIILFDDYVNVHGWESWTAWLSLWLGIGLCVGGAGLIWLRSRPYIGQLPIVAFLVILILGLTGII
jgi:hypothetical protein